MLETFKLNDNLYRSTDHISVILFWMDEDNRWRVYNPRRDSWIACDLDSYDEAESTAYEYLSKVSA